MPYQYGTQGAPAGGGGAPGLPARTGVRGEILFALPGTYDYVIPDGWTSICAVAGGPGGCGFATDSSTRSDISSGAGGALAYTNNIPVSPGQTIRIVVSRGGTAAVPGVASSVTVNDVVVCSAGAGENGALNATAAGGQVIVGDGGGPGGNGAFIGSTSAQLAATGGGAGGYSGKGGNGVAGIATSTTNGNPGVGGAGGSGSVQATGNTFSRSIGSGGVGPFGEGPSGLGGGIGGSGGENGDSQNGTYYIGSPGKFGAGGNATTYSVGTGRFAITNGASGFVRLVSGADRAFPSTDVGPT